MPRGADASVQSPFCVHPTTGRVCVPIDDVDTFSPFDAPSLESLKRELDALPALQIRFARVSCLVPSRLRPECARTRRSEDERLIEQTSLRRYVDFFRSRFVAPILREIAQSRREEAARLGDSAFGLDD
jgi:DNA primase small subunit